MCVYVQGGVLADQLTGSSCLSSARVRTQLPPTWIGRCATQSRAYLVQKAAAYTIPLHTRSLDSCMRHVCVCTSIRLRARHVCACVCVHRTWETLQLAHRYYGHNFSAFERQDVLDMATGACKVSYGTCRMRDTPFVSSMYAHHTHTHTHAFIHWLYSLCAGATVRLHMSRVCRLTQA